MLRSEAQVALHDLLEALREAVDLYTDDAEVLGSGALADLCRELALRRERLSAAVADEVSRHGDLPSEPDADRETLHRIGNRLRAAVSGHDRDVILRDRLDAESELERAAQHALEVVTEPASRAVLEDVHRDVRQARRQLDALRGQ
jgi:uncharacterized protein (TIGR02284 family)